MPPLYIKQKQCIDWPNKNTAVPTPNKDIAKGYKINDCQGEHKVWTLEGNTFTAHPVKIGISNGTLTEILSGITENMPVVTEAVVGRLMPPQMEGVGENGKVPSCPASRKQEKKQ